VIFIKGSNHTPASACPGKNDKDREKNDAHLARMQSDVLTNLARIG